MLRTTGDTKFLKIVGRREARNLKIFSQARGAREENTKIKLAVASSYFASKTTRPIRQSSSSFKLVRLIYVETKIKTLHNGSRKSNKTLCLKSSRKTEKIVQIIEK